MNAIDVYSSECISTRNFKSKSQLLKLFSFAILFIMVSGVSWGQMALTSIGTAVTQNFDALATSGTTNAQTNGIFVAGWSFVEAGSNANTTYSAGTGSSTTGDTYSFGSAA